MHNRFKRGFFRRNCTDYLRIVWQVFQVARENLQNIMDGYCIGEPYFSQRLEQNVNTLIKALKDPALPLLELQVRCLLVTACLYVMLNFN